MASRPSSTSASKARRAAATGLALLAGLNAFINWRAPALLHEESIATYLELERRVAAFPTREKVQVLVYGNSHALAGLRPPQLAQALGLGEDEVFSLAIPSSQPREFLALTRRLAGRFPHARLAIANLDVALVDTNVGTTPRDLFLTADDPVGRWRLARETAPDLPSRLGTVISAPFALAEFAPHLRGMAIGHPKITARSLAMGTIAPLPLSPEEVIARASWRWGYPPPWDVPGYFANEREIRRLHTSVSARWVRARKHTQRLAESLPDAFADLATWEAELRGRGVAVAWVGTPIDPALDATMRVVAPADMAAYERARDAFLATGRTWLPARAPYGPPDFVDYDHLNPGGAGKLCQEVAAGLKARPVSASAPRPAASRPPGSPRRAG